jgi:hypothetical protein
LPDDILVFFSDSSISLGIDENKERVWCIGAAFEAPKTAELGKPDLSGKWKSDGDGCSTIVCVEVAWGERISHWAPKEIIEKETLPGSAGDQDTHQRVAPEPGGVG